MLFSSLLIVITFIIVAMMWTEGLWSNALTFVNVTFAAVLSFQLYELLANYFDDQMHSFTYSWDLLAIWVVFWGSFSVLRAVTDGISTHQVRFRAPVEMGGKAFFALATSWVFICFATATLHMAPTARTSFRGSFGSDPMANSFFGLAPDRLWLGFMHSRSKEGGTLSRIGEPQPFDPEGDFIYKYGYRRSELAKHNKVEGTIGIKSR